MNLKMIQKNKIDFYYIYLYHKNKKYKKCH